MDTCPAVMFKISVRCWVYVFTLVVLNEFSGDCQARHIGKEKYLPAREKYVSQRISLYLSRADLKLFSRPLKNNTLTF